jgi:hypothetical protein
MEQRVVAADVRLTAGKVLLDQSMLAGEPVPHRSRVTPVSWSCRFVAGSGRGRSLRHGVGLRSANCLVDCRRNGESARLCKWPRSRGHSSYTRRFFVEGLTAAFEAGELQFFADLTDLNEAKTLSAREAGGR